MRTINLLFGAMAALCFMAFAVSNASAAGFGGTFAANWNAQSPDFTGDNTGPAVGPHVITTNNNALRVTCTGVTNRGDVVSPTPADVHGHPTETRVRVKYAGCSGVFGGVPVAASVAAGCDWVVTIGTYVPATGGSTATIGTSCDTVLTIGGGACTVTLPSTAIAGTGQNVTAGGLSSPANIPVAGVAFTINGGGASLSSTCPGVAGPWTYAGKKWERGVWIVD